jgi:hypothetical protein
MSSILAKLKRLGLYLKFYWEPNEKALGAEAFAASKAYTASRRELALLKVKPYTASYSQRTADSLAFQRAYKDSYRHAYAKRKLESLR